MVANAAHQPRHFQQYVLLHKPLPTLLHNQQQDCQEIVPLEQARKVILGKVQVGQDGQHLHKRVCVRLLCLLQQHHQALIVLVEAALNVGVVLRCNVVQHLEHQRVPAGDAAANHARQQARPVHFLADNIKVL